MFPVYSVKMAFLFPTNMKLPFCQKKQKLSSPEKYTFGISGIPKKWMLILETAILVL